MERYLLEEYVSALLGIINLIMVIVELDQLVNPEQYGKEINVYPLAVNQVSSGMVPLVAVLHLIALLVLDGMV